MTSFSLIPIPSRERVQLPADQVGKCALTSETLAQAYARLVSAGWTVGAGFTHAPRGIGRVQPDDTFSCNVKRN